MSHYNESKKARRIAAVVYLLIMAIIMGGTYLSEQKKAADKALQNSSAHSIVSNTPSPQLINNYDKF